MFILGVAAGAMLPAGRWNAWLGPLTKSREQLQRERDSELVLRKAGQGGAGERYRVTVLHVIDGDTFDARVMLRPDPDVDTRVRLRGIDAPELKASCAEELTRAEAAARALQRMLDDGGVEIFNLGPDKYERVVADVATRRTPNVSAAMIAAGHARVYLSGRRGSWC